MDTLHRYSLGVALLCAALFFGQGLFGSHNESLTWDEPSFISAGYTYLTRNDFQLNPSHPPLLQDLIALPLLFMDLQVPAADDPRWLQSINPVVQFGRQFFFESGNDLRRMTVWARMPVLLLGTSLVLAIYLWGRQLYGRGPALLATAVAALSPNLLAHAKVATEDLGCTAFMFFAVWSLWRSLKSNRVRDWLLCGVVTGLALVAKYTALILVPICLSLVVISWWPRRRQLKPAAMLPRLCAALVAAVLVVGATYNFSFDYAIYLDGLKKIYTDYPSDGQYYLLGMVADHPFWYYHLAALLIKEPVPILLLIAMAGLCVVQRKGRGEAIWFLLLPAASVLAVSCFDQQNIGMRRILPAFPFLFLFIAEAVTGERQRWQTLFVGVMLAWTVYEAWSIYPHHLSYLNTLAGGPERGPYLLDDSNIDWGQDLPALAAWQEQHGQGRPLRLFYFGSADPAAYGVKAVPMEESELLAPQPGLYAISAHNLVFFRMIQRGEGKDADWLTKYTPVAKAGYSIYIYEF